MPHWTPAHRPLFCRKFTSNPLKSHRLDWVRTVWCKSDTAFRLLKKSTKKPPPFGVVPHVRSYKDAVTHLGCHALAAWRFTFVASKRLPPNRDAERPNVPTSIKRSQRYRMFPSSQEAKVPG